MYLASCYNVQVMPNSDLRALGQQVGAQMFSNQQLKFNPSLSLNIQNKPIKILDKKNKKVWVKYNDINLSTGNIKVLGKLITAQMKLDVVKVKTLIQQMEEGQKKGEGEKMTEESFYKLIIDVSEMFKITIKESETSALAFATYLNKYKLKAEQLQKQNTKI